MAFTCCTIQSRTAQFRDINCLLYSLELPGLLGAGLEVDDGVSPFVFAVGETAIRTEDVGGPLKTDPPNEKKKANY